MPANAAVQGAAQNCGAGAEATFNCREERGPRWDAKQRVWEALDLVVRDAARPRAQRPESSSAPPTSKELPQRVTVESAQRRQL
jgi:hypothetical protein